MAKGKYHKWLEEDGLIRLEGWAREGLTDEQISMKMGIAAGTLYEYKKKYPKIDDVLKKGKEVPDFKVENALYKRATGYRAEEVTYGTVIDKETGEEREIIVKRVIKDVPPDATAIIYWLKNRKPDKWRDKPKGEIDQTIMLAQNVLNLANVIKNPVDTRQLPSKEGEYN